MSNTTTGHLRFRDKVSPKHVLPSKPKPRYGKKPLGKKTALHVDDIGEETQSAKSRLSRGFGSFVRRKMGHGPTTPNVKRLRSIRENLENIAPPHTDRGKRQHRASCAAS